MYVYPKKIVSTTEKIWTHLCDQKEHLKYLKEYKLIMMTTKFLTITIIRDQGLIKILDILRSQKQV